MHKIKDTTIELQTPRGQIIINRTNFENYLVERKVYDEHYWEKSEEEVEDDLILFLTPKKKFDVENCNEEYIFDYNLPYDNNKFGETNFFITMKAKWIGGLYSNMNPVICKLEPDMTATPFNSLLFVKDLEKMIIDCEKNIVTPYFMETEIYKNHIYGTKL